MHTLDKNIKHKFLFGENNRFLVSVANTKQKREAAYKLVYDIYRTPEIDYIDQHPSNMWYSVFDMHPYTTTFVVEDLFDNNKVVATTTIVVDSFLGLPLDQSYPKEILDFRQRGRKCAEIISFAIQEKYRGNRDFILQLMRISYFYARGVRNITDYLIMITPRHVVFYKRMFLFKEIAGDVNCKKIKDKTVRLYHLNLQYAEEQVINARFGERSRTMFDYFHIVLEVPELVLYLRGEVAPVDVEQFEYFFCEKRNLIERLSISQLRDLQAVYRNSEIKMLIGRYIAKKQRKY